MKYKEKNRFKEKEILRFHPNRNKIIERDKKNARREDRFMIRIIRHKARKDKKRLEVGNGRIELCSFFGKRKYGKKHRIATETDASESQ